MFLHYSLESFQCACTVVIFIYSLDKELIINVHVESTFKSW